MFPMLHGMAVQGGGLVATYTVTTTGAQTHTINLLTVTAATKIDWGDGSDNTYTGSGTRTHSYAGAGVYTVKIYTPENVTVLWAYNQSIIGGDIGGLAPLTSLTQLRLNNTGVTGDIGDLATLTSLATLYLNNTGVTGDIGDLATLTSLATLYLRITGVTYTAGAAAWTAMSNLQVQSCGWSSGMVDDLLFDMYTASLSRTATGGTIDVGGTNAAPSGTYQAATSCPVTASTPGKEVAYELLNDTCGAIAAGETWATVTITA